MHVATIPARMGSEGFKFKNRKFFDLTADFLDKTDWFDRVVVSTDDPVVKELVQNRSYEVHHRPKELAGPAISIKQVFSDVIVKMGIQDDDVLWLFYLPVLFKRMEDFVLAKKVIEGKKHLSLCTFIPVKTHPFNCWRYDDQKGILNQYIENDIFRRQDLPFAWAHYHYVCCFYAKELNHLNSEIINENTYPIFLNKETRDQLIEIDTPEDYEKWKKLQNIKE